MNTDWCVRQCLNPDYKKFGTNPRYSEWYKVVDGSNFRDGELTVKNIEGITRHLILDTEDIFVEKPFNEIIKTHCSTELKDALEGWIDPNGIFYGCEHPYTHLLVAREGFHTNTNGLELLGFVKTLYNPLRYQDPVLSDYYDKRNTFYTLHNTKRLTQKQFDVLTERGFKIVGKDMPL